MLDKFDPQEKKQLAGDLRGEAREAAQTAKLNRSLDTAFRVALMLIGMASTVLAGIVNAHGSGAPPEWQTLTLMVLGALSTGLSGFALTQFNFGGRARSWQKKADALIALSTELLYSDPEKAGLLARVTKVRSWNDSTPPDEAPLVASE